MCASPQERRAPCVFSIVWPQFYPMSSDSNPDLWINRQLRSVPLPGGLLRRIKELALGTDDELDAELRQVSVPNSLLSGLKRLPSQEEEYQNRQICDVPVPAGLIGSLKQIALKEDSVLDEALREVPIPAGLIDSLKPAQPVTLPNGLTGRRRWASTADVVLAASLMLIVGLSYLGGVAGLMTSIYQVADRSSGLNIADSVAIEGHLPEPSALEVVVAGDADVENTTPWWPIELIDPSSPDGLPASGELVRMIELFGSPEFDPMWNTEHARWGLFTADGEMDRFRRLETAEAIVPRGVDPPIVKEVDWLFFAEHGVHPIITPASHRQLRICDVPLGAGTQSFEAALRQVSMGKLPDAREIAVEDFLAAMDYGFRRPDAGQIAIRTAAGPSPFGDPGTQLLQVAVQAGTMRTDRRSTRLPTRLTVAIDVSRSMSWGGRLETVREALRRLVRHLGPNDRLALVTFSESVEVLIRDAGTEDVEILLESINSITARKATNLGAGVMAACSLAMQGANDPGVMRRIVLLTDTLPSLSPKTSQRIVHILEDSHDDGVMFDIIDLSGDLTTDLRLTDFTKAGGGQLTAATTVNQTAWALRTSLAGRAEVVASDVRLRVIFNPKAVQKYRLVGHAPGVKKGPLEVELRADQAATGLFELLLNPGGGDQIGTVEVTWRDPATGEVQPKLTQLIGRLQFGLSSAPSLQMAALAAQTAEILSGSRFSKGQKLAGVLKQADYAPSSVWKSSALRRLITLAEEAARLEARRGR
jgi:Ca-activated chloride channel family protein